MKKFYESPMVELTVFDTEDIMTESGLSTTEDENAEALVKEYTSKNTNAVWGKFKGGSYNWK